MVHGTYDIGLGIPIFKACSGTSVLYLLRLGNTLFHSTVQLPAGSLASVEVILTFKNLGRQTNKQTAVFV